MSQNAHEIGNCGPNGRTAVRGAAFGKLITQGIYLVPLCGLLFLEGT